MKDPAFLFYPGDWNLGTMHLTLLEKGCYIELLILQFAKGKFTEAHAKHMLNGSFDYAWNTLKDKFETDGVFYWNKRLEIEKEKRKNYTESRRSNASKSKDNKENKITYAKDMQEHMHKHMEDENINKYLYNNNEILEKMIVKEMMKVWLQLNPRYKMDEGLDYSACLELSYKIAIDLGIHKSRVILIGNSTNLNDLMILEKWEEYIKFIILDSYFSKLTVSGVANKKNWQSIQNSIDNKPEKKEPVKKMVL